MAKKRAVDKKTKQRKEELKKSLEYEQSIKSIIYNVVGILSVFLLFYLVTYFITNNSRRLNVIDVERLPVEIQYKEILAGETFNRPESEYYVLFYDFDGEEAAYYSTIINDFFGKIYTVDLGKGFNKPFVSDETNKNVQKASDLRVREATLIKIKNNKNVSYIEGNLEEIGDNIK